MSACPKCGYIISQRRARKRRTPIPERVEEAVQRINDLRQRYFIEGSIDRATYLAGMDAVDVYTGMSLHPHVK